MDYDVKIAGGTIVDGTGAEGYRGDVGIKHGKVSALGSAPGDAMHTIDADGCVIGVRFLFALKGLEVPSAGLIDIVDNPRLTFFAL